MDYNKKDDITLEATKTPVVEPETTEYKLDQLKQQELNIIKQRNDFVKARNAELEEVKVLIAKCEELGIKSEAVVAKEAEEAKLAEELAKEEDEAEVLEADKIIE
jgi:hypothetical protein